MSDTPTPRTDLALQSTSNTSAVYVFAEFARALERESDALRKELEEVKTQREQSHASNIKLKSGWQRLGDQCKGGNGPQEFIRFNDACAKHNGDVVETMLSYLFSLWNDHGKSQYQLAAAQKEIEELKREQLASNPPTSPGAALLLVRSQAKTAPKASDMDEPLGTEPLDLLQTINALTYIAQSPTPEHGGFHENTVHIAKSALRHLEKPMT